MFLSRRSTQAEYFDEQRSVLELEKFYRALNAVNRLFAFAHPFQHWVPAAIGAEACRSLSILDVGAGDGALGRELALWAEKRCWDWRITSLDVSQPALLMNSQRGSVVGSALALPFKDASFDAAISSQMAHHLTDDQVVQMLRETNRVARAAVVISDLHRNAMLYASLWLLLRLLPCPAEFRADALLSVHRGWRVKELSRLAARAGLERAQVRIAFGARVIFTSVRT
ncbi:MAG: methyltransferase domain-containing protein [Limisphaerales bacterium]